MIETFRGKPVNEMSREELIETILILGNEARKLYEPDIIRGRALARVERFKKNG